MPTAHSQPFRMSRMPEARVPRTLFKPGAGGFPPYLAGRAAALDDLAHLGDSLRAGEAPSQDAVLYGPRGNGKTVLMREFLNRTGDVPDLQVIRLTPDKIPDLPALCRNIVRERPGRSLIQRLKAVKRLDISPSETGLPGLGIEFDTPAETRLLPEILDDRISEGPLVLALDEAHVLHPAIGQALLNVVQDMRDKGRPVLLMLAGTPGLKAHLGTMDASFWGRCCDVAVGLLNGSASAEALAVPLQRYGVTFTEDALRTVVEEANGYPYFLQLWGLVLTRNLNHGQQIADDQVQAAFPDFDRKRRVYYLDRHNELRRRGLLTAATALAGIFRSSSAADEDTILTAIRPCVGDEQGSAQETLDGLVQLGYVWQDDTGSYVPGIPSLMNYVQAA